jgi:hypothetical protein
MQNKKESPNPAIMFVTQAVVEEMIKEALKPYEKLIAKKASSIHKVEEFNGEVIPEQRESSIFTNYTFDDKVFSARNAAKILNPKLVVDGRHSAENIRAICGFEITDELMDAIYDGFKHEDIEYYRG